MGRPVLSAIRCRRAAVPLFILAVAIIGGCAGKRPPVLDPLRNLESRTPVVLIPGITGTQLRDRDTGRILWGNARSIFFPRDGGYSLALPVDPESGRQDNLEAFAPVIGFRVFGVVKVDIYASLIRLMESNGYRLGDLKAPRPDDTFFLFPYDWRDGNIRATRELADMLENLRRVRGEDVLRVNFICQSNAVRIARYFIKYGAASLEEAEAGAAARPPSIHVEKLIMVGTGNGGAFGTLYDLNRGRSYVPLVGRKFQQEVAFTYSSLYEALPAYRRDLFFDARGDPMDVDIYDPDNWRRFGWSIYARAVQKRLRKAQRTGLFGDPESRATFLADALDKARRLHRLLAADVETFGDTKYYSVQNVYRPTADRVLLVQKGGRWRTLFNTDKRLKKDAYLFTLASAPGDGHATLDSQMWLSPQEKAALARPAVFIPAYHRKIILNPATHKRILEFLLD